MTYSWVVWSLPTCSLLSRNCTISNPSFRSRYTWYNRLKSLNERFSGLTALSSGWWSRNMPATLFQSFCLCFAVNFWMFELKTFWHYRHQSNVVIVNEVAVVYFGCWWYQNNILLYFSFDCYWVGVFFRSSDWFLGVDSESHPTEKHLFQCCISLSFVIGNGYKRISCLVRDFLYSVWDTLSGHMHMVVRIDIPWSRSFQSMVVYAMMLFFAQINGFNLCSTYLQNVHWIR